MRFGFDFKQESWSPTRALAAKRLTEGWFFRMMGVFPALSVFMSRLSQRDVLRVAS